MPPRTRPRSRGRSALAWLALLSGALAVRLFFAARAPIIEVDGAYWAHLAQAFARGDGRHAIHAAWPPLYPMCVATVSAPLARFGGAPGDPERFEQAGRLVSAIAGTLLLIPLFALARVFLGLRAAAWCAVLAAVHPRLIASSASALSEMLYTLLLLLGLAAWILGSRLRRGEPWADPGGPAREGPGPESRAPRPAAARLADAASGALFGCAFLSRPEGLVLAAALWIGNARTRRRREGLRWAFAFALIAVSIPYALAMHERLGRWSPGEKGAYNFWRAYAAEYDRAFGRPESLVRYVNDSPERTDALRPERVRVLEFAAREPSLLAARTLSNFARIVGSTLPVAGYAPVFVLAIFGAVLARRRAPSELFFVLAIVIALYSPLSPDRRFFVPLVPVLLLFSAAALERAAARWPSRVGNAPVALLCALSLAYAAAKGVRFDDAPEQRVAGAWLARSGWPPEVGAAGARPAVMARKPWVAYYAGADMLELPEAPLEEVLELAATRAADVLVADARSVRESRPALAPLLPVSAAPPGLRPLHAVGGEKPIVLWDARGLSRR